MGFGAGPTVGNDKFNVSHTKFFFNVIITFMITDHEIF